MPERRLPYAQPRVLVVGADGLVGSALIEALEKRRIPVVGTTRRRTGSRAGRRYLDLEDPSSAEALACEAAVAVMCAGIGDVGRCESDPAGTSAVNVDGVVSLSRVLLNLGVRVVYLSTNQVFDGSIDHPSADAPVSPTTQAGQQKANVERALHPFGNRVAIVRMAKVLSPEFKLFRGWLDEWRAGRVVRAFSDMPLAPVSVGYVVGGILRVLRSAVDGVVHLSGDEDVTYAEAAAIGSEALGVGSDLIEPVPAARAGLTVQFPPRAALGYGVREAALGLVPPSSRTTVRDWFRTTDPRTMAARA